MASCRGCPGALVVLALLLAGATAAAAAAAGETKGAPANASVIGVPNGGPRGLWAPWDMCPPRTFATGASIKMEPSQGPLKDDTGLNGIRLFCTQGGRDHYREDSPVESLSGPWGHWSPPLWCAPNSYVVGFSLKVEPARGAFQDYMGATGVRLVCSDGQILEGSGLSWGQYGQESPRCRKGLCGVQTKQEGDRGPMRDDSTLNDARFLCCAA